MHNQIYIIIQKMLEKLNSNQEFFILDELDKIDSEIEEVFFDLFSRAKKQLKIKNNFHFLDTQKQKQLLELSLKYAKLLFLK